MRQALDPQAEDGEAPMDLPAGRPQRFGPGDIVVVRSAAEIAATLDDQGAFEGMAFMPEMTRFCGRRMRVRRRAEKTCVEGQGLRGLSEVVLLESARCDGAAHDGCQRNCMIFWKEAWLKAPMPGDRGLAVRAPDETWAKRRLERAPVRREQRYACQSTRLAQATRPLSTWSLGHLAGDLKRGEITLGRLARVISLALANRTRRLVRLADLGTLSGAGGERPAPALNLQPGDWVRIRSAPEISATLDAGGRNLGLAFKPEMAAHLGGVFQVEARIERVIGEATGAMTPMADTVALRGLACRGLCLGNCPRNAAFHWREAWLERVPAPTDVGDRGALPRII